MAARKLPHGRTQALASLVVFVLGCLQIMHPRQRENRRFPLRKPSNVGKSGLQISVDSLTMEGSGYVYPFVLVQVDYFQDLASRFVDLLKRPSI